MPIDKIQTRSQSDDRLDRLSYEPTTEEDQPKKKDCDNTYALKIRGQTVCEIAPLSYGSNFSKYAFHVSNCIAFNCRSLSEIKNMLMSFMFFNDKSSYSTDPSSISRINQNVVSVHFSVVGRGYYNLICSTDRYSLAAKEFVLDLWEKCKQATHYWMPNLALQVVEDRLAAYEKEEAFFPVLDLDLVRSMLGYVQHAEYRRDDYDQIRTYENRVLGFAAHRIVLFVPDKVTQEQVLSILHAQQKIALKEVIVYQSARFTDLLKIVEECDAMSAYPLSTTWNPKELLGLSGVYSKFHCNDVDDVAATEVTTLKSNHQDFYLYLMELQLAHLSGDNCQLDVLKAMQAYNKIDAQVTRTYFNADAIKHLPKQLFSVPANFEWHCGAEHRILSLPPTEYHTVDTSEWISALSKPRVAWDIAHKLWVAQCNNVPMSYPAGQQLIGIIRVLLNAMLSSPEEVREEMGVAPPIPDALKTFVNEDSWENIQEIKSFLVERSWYELYVKINEEINKEIESIATALLPYAADRLHKVVVVFLELLEAFYTFGRLARKLNLFENKSIQDMYNTSKLSDRGGKGFFPLLLLGRLPMELLLSNQVMPTACMQIHLNSYEIHYGTEFSGIELASFELNAKKALYGYPKVVEVEDAYAENHIYRLRANDSRHALVCTLFDMLDRLEVEGGVLNNVARLNDIPLDKCYQDIKVERDFLVLAMYVLLHELREPFSKVNFYSVFDIGVPSISEVQGALYNIFKYETRINEAPLKLHHWYRNWNEETIKSFGILPLDGESPVPFTILASWLGYCLEEYDRNPSASLGDIDSIQQFNKQYLAPMLNVKLAIMEKEGEHFPKQDLLMSKLPIDLGEKGIPVSILNRAFPLHPRRQASLNSPYVLEKY